MRRRLLGPLVAALLALVSPAGARADTVKVAATIFPVYDIARQVAGPVADVVLILRPGASPHTFEPTPAGVRALAGARALFVVGHGLDTWAARLARGAGISRLVQVEPTRRIATVHEAFGYFADAYGLEVAAVFEPYPGLEPSPRFVVEFQKKIRASGVRVLFTEPQLSLEALRPIARDLGVTLAVLDPLGGLPGRQGLVGLGLHRFERMSRLSLDTILGFVLPFFMAIGVLVLSLTPGFQPELLSYLFGSILTVGWPGLGVVAVVSAIVAVVLARRGRALVFAAVDPEGAHAAGLGVAALLTLQHVLLALAVIASISVVGIVLGNALLVIPAATAKLLARSLGQMFVLAPLFGVGSVLVGLVVSSWADTPSGPAIVVVAGIVFLTAWASTLWQARRPPESAARTGGAA